MCNNDLEKEIEEIWEKYKDIIPRYPDEKGIVLSPKFQYKVDYTSDINENFKGHICFVGLNPSFKEKAINKILLDKKINGNATSVFNFEKYKANKSIIDGIDIGSIKHYSYFKPLKEFADENKISFSYFDLFLIRCSRQEELLNYLNDEVMSDFFRSQLEFFVKAISSEVKNYDKIPNNIPLVFLNSLTYSFYKCLKLLKFPDKALTDNLKKFKEYYCPLNRFTRSKFKNNLKELLKNDL